MTVQRLRVRVRGAEVFGPRGSWRSDVGVDAAGQFVLDPPRHLSSDAEVDAHGLALLPGVIDDQVHFRDPGLTHKEDLWSASRAAVRGGVTSYLEMPNTVPSVTTQARLATKLALAKHKSLACYGFYLGAASDPATGAASNLAELANVVQTPGIKIFIGSSTGDLLVDNQQALELIFATGTRPICAHCEDEATIAANRAAQTRPPAIGDHSRGIRDVPAAVRATRRALDLAVRHRRRFHLLHVSTAAECALLLRFYETGELPDAATCEALATTPAGGLLTQLQLLEAGRIGRLATLWAHDDVRHLITAEVCPHHVDFAVDDYDRLNSRVQMNPSIKTRDDGAALWAALGAGIIQVGATDHAPHTLAEKARPYPASPSGLPAVQQLLPWFLTRAAERGASVASVVQWLCEAPAAVWGVVGKGRVAEGWDGDFSLIDLDAPFVVRDEEQSSRAGWSPWHGRTLRGIVRQTWVGGSRVWHDGAFGQPLGDRALRFASDVPEDLRVIRTPHAVGPQ